MTPSPLIALHGVTARIRERRILEGTTWSILPGENWAVIGPNGAGKSSLVKILTGDLPHVAGTVSRPAPLPGGGNPVGLVSFERAQRIVEADLDRDGARGFSRNPEALQDVRGLLGEAVARRLSGDFPAFDAGPLLDRPVRSLSNGELRKVSILRALAGDPLLLVLDEPFDGLDPRGRAELKALLSRVVREGRQLVLVSHRYEELIPEISHLICLKEGRVVHRGPCLRPLPREGLERFTGPSAISRESGAALRASTALRSETGEVLIRMRNATVRYGSTAVISGLDWAVRKGENWAVSGPNGCGKTTLMGLIAADHPQAYANDITLFGKKRGSGESIWEIKRRIGLMSAEFHAGYHPAISVLEAVISGFFDSVGLYRSPHEEQIAAARRWVARVGLTRLADRPLDRLSYGEKRLALLARSMVKSPCLLILDEACQGLDPANRDNILSIIDGIGRSPHTQIIFITHHPDEIPTCTTHRLSMEPPYAWEATPPMRQGKETVPCPHTGFDRSLRSCFA